VAIVIAPQPVAAALMGWKYDATKQQLEVTLNQETTPKYFVMAQPARIVVDLPNTNMGEVKARETFSGAVRQIRVSQFQPGVTRFVLELAPDVELAPGQVNLEAKGERVVLRPLFTKTTIAKAASTAKPSTPKPSDSKRSDAKPASNAKQPATSTTTTAISRGVAKQAPQSPPIPLALGADVSPVTKEPLPPTISVPLPTPDAKPEATKPAKPLPPVAQLPVEATTPLPPETLLPPAGFAIESKNAVPISVPPPTSTMPVQPEVMTVPQVKVAPPPPLQSPPGNTVVQTLEIPSTVRSLPATPAPQVAVPTLSPGAPSANVPVLPKVNPTPPPLAVPPLNPPVPQPLKPPVSSVIQLSESQSVGQIQSPTADSLPTPTPQFPTSSKQPPNSWVMQSPGMTAPGSGVPSGSSPAATFPATTSAPVVPSVTKITPPPNSWVMQSSTAAQPSLTRSLPAPPVSSVIQPPAQSTGSNPTPAPISAIPQPAPIPVALPAPAPLPTGAAGMVSVPPLQASLGADNTPTVSVPSLQPTPTPSINSVPNAAAGNTSTVIEFGKPLPNPGAVALNTMPKSIPTIPNASVSPIGRIQSANPAIALPTGTVLALSYPGTTELQLGAVNSRQDMMVLQTEVRDAAGNVVFPQGSYVMGQFETTATGSKFFTSSIQRGDRIVPFFAESEPLTGGNRDVSTSSIALYSGAGALAGGLISRFSGWGILLGGAAGAATNLLTAPKPATIQPGQVIQVRMLKDIPY
jgi:hypothetical protein